MGKIARIGWMQRLEGFSLLNPIPIERDERITVLSGSVQLKHHDKIFTLAGRDVAAAPADTVESSFVFANRELAMFRNPRGTDEDPRAFYLFTEV